MNNCNKLKVTGKEEYSRCEKAWWEINDENIYIIVLYKMAMIFNLP